MQNTLKRLCEYELLDRQTACDLLSAITSGYYNETQIAGFLSVFLMRKPTVEEMQGFRDAMMNQCIPVDLSMFEAIDIVGTGGDGKNTFNISTLAALVTAGAGVKVVKHGNYAASSVSGSSDVLEYLGYRFSADNNTLKHQLEKANICFLHAPLFHPAMKSVASVRKNLGLRTFFNLLGPIINPAQPAMQVLGVSHLAFARMYHYLLQGTAQQYRIIHSLDGYDEISLTAAFKVISPQSEQTLHPHDIGFECVDPKEIEAGTSVKDAAKIFINILEGKGTMAQNHVIIANSGYAIHCANPDKSLAECMETARESLTSGKAFTIFKQIINEQS